MQKMQQDNNGSSIQTSQPNTMSDIHNHAIVSIVLGAISKRTDAYQPNPVYIDKGQTIIWINSDNNFHTVTQKGYYDTTAKKLSDSNLRFNSGIISKGIF